MGLAKLVACLGIREFQDSYYSSTFLDTRPIAVVNSRNNINVMREHLKRSKVTYVVKNVGPTDKPVIIGQQKANNSDS